MKRLTLLLCALAACGEHALAPPAFTARGWAVSLPAGNPCMVQADDAAGRVSRKPLAFGGPCELIRDHQGAPQARIYGEVTVVVAVGEIKNGCGPVAQGILVRDQGVTLSERITRGSLKCPAAGLDEKEFWLFGHR